MSKPTLLVADDHPLFRAAVLHVLRERLPQFRTLEAASAATLGTALEAPMTRLMQTASDVPQAAAQVIAQLRQEMVQLTAQARGHRRVKAALAAAESRGFPEWLEVDAKAGKGTFKAYPVRSELPATINEGLVVELYSR